MSEFDIKGEAYSSSGEMRKVIHRTFDVGDEFKYAYDFGSTTNLRGKIISVRSGRLQKNIRLLARNNLPEDIKCTTCEKHPKVICSVCYDFCCGKNIILAKAKSFYFLWSIHLAWGFVAIRETFNLISKNS